MCSSDYRARARQMLSGKWGMAILVTLVAGLLGGLAAGASGSTSLDIDAETIAKFPEFIQTYFMFAASVGGVLGFIQFVIGTTVQLGYSKYLLKLHDGEEAELRDLFSEFHRFGDAFVMGLLRSLYTFLWTLLFIIPGIIAAYKYAMAHFILLENPGMKPKDAITASKEMMDGHKFELFCLGLSFFGWSLLCIMTLGIGSLWLNPYVNASYAAFYRQIGNPPVCDATEPTNPW